MHRKKNFHQLTFIILKADTTNEKEQTLNFNKYFGVLEKSQLK